MDEAGRSVEVPQPLKRIIPAFSYAGQALRLLKPEHYQDLVVGIPDYMSKDRMKYLQPEIADKPTFGSTWEPNFEKIGELNPQIVLVPDWVDVTKWEEKLSP